MPEDRKTLTNCIVSFLCLVIIFLIGGYYSKLENLLLISAFFPIVFIPIILLIAYKGLYVKTKQLVYFTAMIFSLFFFVLMANFRQPELLNLPTIRDSYLVILLFSFIVSLIIHIYSYQLIRFFGIRIDDKVIENIKTISFTVEADAKKTKSLVKFFLTEILTFEYIGGVDFEEMYKFYREPNETVLIKYAKNQSPSTYSLSLIIFYNDQDGIRAFDSEIVHSYSLIMEKLIGGNITETPEGIKDELNKYFSRYRPIVKEISEYFGESQIKWREIKSPIIIVALVIAVAYAIFNIERIIQFISGLSIDTVVKIAVLPAATYYILKIFGKVK
ncbi:MAG: hypothetical protein O8C66_10950 [Candidatus Methanoperedens sp.]|nr:hypothetical protein [Candidatus Methanoperedens sp.]MCZ7371016.1 hypothetical protein [Candidatus Methanoperedens sp.]